MEYAGDSVAIAVAVAVAVVFLFILPRACLSQSTISGHKLSNHYKVLCRNTSNMPHRFRGTEGGICVLVLLDRRQLFAGGWVG